MQRTVPLSFDVYSIIIVWYPLHGYHPDDPTAAAATSPLSQHKLPESPQLHPAELGGGGRCA